MSRFWPTFFVLVAVVAVVLIGNNVLHADILPSIFLAPPQPSALLAAPKSCWRVADADRVDCHPEANPTENVCSQRGCCWTPTPAGLDIKENISPAQAPLGRNTCFFPPQYNRTYSVTSVRTDSTDLRVTQATLQLPQPTRFSTPDVNTLTLNVTYETANRMRLTLDDASPNAARWKTPYPILQPKPALRNTSSSDMYKFQMSRNQSIFGFSVSRAQDDAVVFDATDVGAPLIYTDQLLMLSARLPGVQAIYGLGEHWERLNLLGGRYTFFNTDNSPTPNGQPGYGSVPFFIALGATGNAELLTYGVYLHNSNAMEIEITQDGVITYRVTGGILDFYFFFGPTPEDIVRQFTELVGRPQMPPYWSLGYHLCRWGYANVSETQRIFQRNIDAGVPVQTQWNDIDYMIEKYDFTYDPVAFANLSGFVQSLHDSGRNYMVILDVGIPNFLKPGSYAPYDEGTSANVWIMSPNGTVPLVGQVWPGETVYPDFTHPNTSTWWSRQVKQFHSQIPVDGLWIDMNEPANFYDGSITGCPNNSKLDYPAYQPPLVRDHYFSHAICMSAKHYLSTHYNLHNVYAYTQAVATHQALLELDGGKKRPFIVSRANAAGMGVYSNHWSGDVFSTWYDMRRSIPHMLSYNMFGVPMVGTDICGFNGNATEELCLRWQQLGAFYPFSRNHNSIGMVDQDPAAWSAPTTAAMRAALDTRYQLLPYFYTLFAYATFHGGTVVRPLSFEFPHDITTYPVDWQFLIGSGVMVIPVLDEGAKTVVAYFSLVTNSNNATRVDEVWYNFYTGELLASKSLTPPSGANGVYIELAAPLDTINVALRGGSVIPLQKSAMTLPEARANDFYLYVALDARGSAAGTLYWDSGNEFSVPTTNDTFNLIQFSALGAQGTYQGEGSECTEFNAAGIFTTTPQQYKYDQETMVLDSVRFSGVKSKPASGVWAERTPSKSTSTVVGAPIPVDDWNYNATLNTLTVQLEPLIVTLISQWTIYWC